MNTSGNNTNPGKEKGKEPETTGNQENRAHHPDNTEAENNEDYESGPESKGKQHRNKTETSTALENEPPPGSAPQKKGNEKTGTYQKKNPRKT